METHRPRSLAFLAQKACTKYLKRITDIGDCPYDLIRPVLLKLENPDQLHQLEINSPQLIGRDGEIWLQLIKRDIPGWETKPHEPENPKNWWKVYRKLKEQTQRDREQRAEKLKAALDSIKDEREQKLAKVVARKDLPREPTNHKARTIYNFNSGKSGSRLRGKPSLLEKIRKEARDARLARTNVPTSQLVKRANEVKKAPQGLVEEYKLSAQQKDPGTLATRPPSTSRVPRPPLAHVRQDRPATEETLLEREERLRALTEGRAKRPTKTSDSRAGGTDQLLESSANSQPLPKPRPQLPQSDGILDEDVEEPQGSETLGSSKKRGAPTANNSPKRLMGTPPRSRLGSPGQPPKRKAEPSIFMSAKKPKVAR